MISRLVLDQPESVVIGAAAEFPATVVAGYSPGDRLHAVDHGEAVGANVGVVPLHLAALEGQVMKRLLAGNPEVHAGRLPLGSMWIDAAAAAAFVSDKVGEFVLQRAPEFLRLALLELRIQLDRPVWPPRAAGGRLHPRVPGYADLAGELVESE